MVFIRMGFPDDDSARRLVAKYDPIFPTGNAFLDRELCQLLVYLNSPTVVAKATDFLKGPSKVSPNPGLQELLARNKGYGGAIQKMIDNGADMQKFSYVFSLRNVKTGWTLDQRKAYFGAIAEGRTKSGGNSFQGFLNNIEKEAFENASEGDRLVIEAAGLRKPF